MAAFKDMKPMYKNNRINSEVSRASHTHQVPHIGLPHKAPVHKARKVNKAPVGASAEAIKEDSRVLNTNPIPAYTAITT